MRAAETGLPTSTGGNEPGCFTGASAVEWLLRQPLRDKPTREQAVALGVRLVQYGVIEAVETDPRRYPDHWVVAVQWHPEERLDDLRLFAGLVQASSAFAQRKTQKVSA